MIEGKNSVRLATTARNQRGEVVLSGEALVHPCWKSAILGAVEVRD